MYLKAMTLICLQGLLASQSRVNTSQQVAVYVRLRIHFNNKLTKALHRYLELLLSLTLVFGLDIRSCKFGRHVFLTLGSVGCLELHFS